MTSATYRTCRTVATTANGNWQGGRTLGKRGYVLVRTNDHPRAAKSGYVFEHIRVMERSLGRQPCEGETVHHLNGVRDDNRIENFESWTRPPPTGVRVSGAIEWAQSNFRHYDNDAMISSPTITDCDGR